MQTTAIVPRITGLHHVTAIAGDPQANLDFYTGVLGLRLVKRTVNFDDPSAYHLYYGDTTGAPGTIVTFFYWPGVAARGRVGSGQMTALVFSAAPSSLDFWQARLTRRGIVNNRKLRFGEEAIEFADPDGLPIEIVAVAEDSRAGWTGSDVPAEHALRGLHTAPLAVRAPQATETLLTGPMGWRLVRREAGRARFAPPDGDHSGAYVDVAADHTLPPGRGGSGTVHHLAFSVPDDAAELAQQKTLWNAGVAVSDVRDRQYFHSIYYREPSGVLFEIATAEPGFAVDEAPSGLGSSLRLPPWLEDSRTAIARALPPLRVAGQAHGPNVS